MSLAALLGHPVGHSRSPALMAVLSERTGRSLRYELWDVLPSELPTALEELRVEPDLVGANITVPHKVEALRLADTASETAQRAGAANVLVRRDGRLFAHNTDVFGFQESLRQTAIDVAEQTVLVLGAGGAARAVVVALLDLGVAEVRVHNRSAHRARALCGLDPRRVDLARASGAPPALVVHCTSLGLRPGDTPRLEGFCGPLLRELSAGTPALDIVYGAVPGRTPFLELASASGLHVAGDGRCMLAAQALRAFELWMGRVLDPPSLFPHLLQALG